MATSAWAIDRRQILGSASSNALELVRMSYLPQEVYLVETYAGGREVRMYTTWYVERLARNRQPLPPLGACQQ